MGGALDNVTTGSAQNAAVMGGNMPMATLLPQSETLDKDNKNKEFFVVIELNLNLEKYKILAFGMPHFNFMT